MLPLTQPKPGEPKVSTRVKLVIVYRENRGVAFGIHVAGHPLMRR